MKKTVRAMLLGTRIEPFWKHVIIAVPLATVPAVVLTGLSAVAAHLVAGDVSGYMRPLPVFSLGGFLATGIAAPVAETLLMAVTLPLIHAFAGRIVRTAIVSGLLWGFFHALISPFALVGPAWAFFVYSASYLAWREISFTRAFAVGSIPHAINNAVVYSTASLFSGG